jgi:hypothetical protein
MSSLLVHPRPSTTIGARGKCERDAKEIEVNVSLSHWIKAALIAFRGAPAAAGIPTADEQAEIDSMPAARVSTVARSRPQRRTPRGEGFGLRL